MRAKTPKKVEFTSGSLMRHVAIMSLTSSLGVMAIYIVDLCDILFISLLGEKQMAAAAGFASTLMFFVSAVSVGVSTAAAVLVSMAMGAGQKQRARSIATSAAIISAITATVFSSLLLFYVDPILLWIGATDELVVMSKSYLWIVLPSSMLSGMSMVAVATLRSDGQARWAMYPSLIGAAVNLVLDPVFIFALDFGLEGAAMATVVARMATLAVALFASAHLNGLFAVPEWRSFQQQVWPIARYTAPAVVSSLAAPVGMAIVTRYMAEFGADAVAGMAVVGRLYPVVFSVVNALAGASGPIIGQNFGAGKIDRVAEAYVASLKFLAFYVLVVSILLLLIRPYIGQAFSLDGLSLDLLFIFCGPLAIIAFFNGTVMVSNAVFANIGHPNYPVWVQWGRSTLGVIPFVEVGSRYWGAPGVFIGATAGGAVFAGFASLLAMKTIARAATEKTELEADRTPQIQNVPRHQSPWEG